MFKVNVNHTVKNSLIILVVLLSTRIFSQVPDFSSLNFSSETMKIEESLDRLHKLWYIGKMSRDTNIANLNKYNYRPHEIPSYHDTVYEKRLDDLQSLIPLPYNHIIRRFIELYAVRKRDQVETMLGLSVYYFPLFEAELSRQGLPIELRYIPVIESALNTHAVSRSGATGLWQFMYATGRMYDLQITSYIDERRDPYRLTEKAVTYFKDLYHVFNDWLYVIAAYNCGPGALNRAIIRSGYKTDFWQVYPFLPDETRGYIPAFIAANYIMQYNIEHNLYPKNIYDPGMLDTIHITRRLRFDVIANALQIPIGKIEELNPQYIKNIIPQSATGQAYILRLPIQDAARFHAHHERIFRYQEYVDQKEKEKSMGVKDTKITNPFPQENANSYTLLKYTVKSGDNLNGIAEWYDCSERDILRWNNMSGGLNAGRVLNIYVPSQKAEHYARINTMSWSEKMQMVGKMQPSITEKDLILYTVKQGDTLWNIARQFPGVTPAEIMSLNNIGEDGIKPGQTIKIQQKK